MKKNRLIKLVAISMISLIIANIAVISSHSNLLKNLMSDQFRNQKSAILMCYDPFGCLIPIADVSISIVEQLIAKPVKEQKTTPSSATDMRSDILSAGSLPLQKQPIVKRLIAVVPLLEAQQLTDSPFPALLQLLALSLSLPILTRQPGLRRIFLPRSDIPSAALS